MIDTAIVTEPDTGEMLEVSRACDYTQLAQLYLEAADQEKRWKALKAAYGQLLLAKLERDDQAKVPTSAGTVSLVRSERRVARADRIPDVAEQFGLTPDQVAALWQCADTLDLELLRSWIEDLVAEQGEELTRRIHAALVDVTLIAYAKVTPPRKRAPELKVVEP